MKSNAAYITVVYKYNHVFIFIFWEFGEGRVCLIVTMQKNRRNFCHAKYNFLYWSCNVGVKCEQDMFFHEIHPFAVSFTRTYAAYQGKWGAVFWDLSSRYILLDKRAPMWQNTGQGGQITYCTRLGFYGPLHIDRDQTATATQTIP